ncbi:Hpt domain-containing protein [Nitrincola lacisaponensis]|uniref:Hpt domain-containing protein n=1 Tax=Nitrincola lacisaponensis TaxID=267850 RepID=UPI000566822D|nr:Hpt domain-containing protein [Nitrincola lacisaponensis]
MSDKQYDEMRIQLAQIRHDYLKHLPEELATLQAMGESLGDSEYDLDCLKAIYQRLHKLSGSGGSFGLKTLSAEASKLEQKVKDLLSQSSVQLDASLKQQLILDLAALMNTLTQAEVPTSVVPVDNRHPPR